MSDHISGPRAIAHPITDITDMYAFPSPERPGRLVLVLNSMPHADPAARFSDGLIYRFRLRAVTPAADGPAAVFAVGTDELTIGCTFSPAVSGEGNDPSTQEGRCVTSTGEEVVFAVDDERGGHDNGLRVFAGPRSDPFFLDLDGLRDMFKNQRLTFTDPGPNGLAGHNVLSIVVDVDAAAMLGAGPLLAVVAETGIAGTFPVRLERFGRPETKNWLFGPTQFDPVNRDIELRDLYGMEDAFHLAETYLRAYHARIEANLAFFDGLNEAVDWPPIAQGTHPLTELMLADFTVVDVSKPFAEESYFEIERALLAGRPHETCGGRSLNEDVVDTLYTLLINAGTGPRIRDGVDQATVPASRTYPYLAPPRAMPTDGALISDQAAPAA
jgi:hypothetical protein